MLSGAMVAHASHLAIINANAWFPLVFLLARRGLLENRRCCTLAAGFFFGIENLTGHFQHAVFLGLLLFLYFAYEACAGPVRAQLWPRWIWQLALIAAIGAGLAMIQILPTAELSPLSVRTQVAHWDVTQGNDPAYLWTLFLPNYLGGINGVPYLRALDPSFNYIFLTVPGCLFALVGLIEMARQEKLLLAGAYCGVLDSVDWKGRISRRVPLQHSDLQPVPARAHVFRSGQLRALPHGSRRDADSMG